MWLDDEDNIETMPKMDNLLNQILNIRRNKWNPSKYDMYMCCSKWLFTKCVANMHCTYGWCLFRIFVVLMMKYDNIEKIITLNRIYTYHIWTDFFCICIVFYFSVYVFVRIPDRGWKFSQMSEEKVPWICCCYTRYSHLTTQSLCVCCCQPNVIIVSIVYKRCR